MLKPFIYLPFFTSFLFSIFMLNVAHGQGNSRANRFSFTAQKMGSPFHLTFFDVDSVSAEQHARTSFELIDSLNHIFSNYDSSSEVSKINELAGVKPANLSPLMQELLLLSKEAYYQSKGTFNIAMGPLTSLWRQSRKAKIFPSTKQVSARLQLCQFNALKMDTLHRTIFLSKKGMQLDFGGIAKGYIAQQIIKRLAQQGISKAIADAGGDIVMSEAPFGAAGWKVGVNLPEQEEQLLEKKLILKNTAIATSGGVYQFFLHKGMKYSHIINPFTGYGVTSLRNVTIVCENGAVSDWLATACSILPIPQAKALALKMGAQLIMGVVEKNEMNYYTTPGVDKLWEASK